MLLTIAVSRQSTTATPTRRVSKPQTPNQRTPSRLSLGQPRSAKSTAASSYRAAPQTPTAPRHNRTPTAPKSVSRIPVPIQYPKTPQSQLPPPRTPTSRQSIANPGCRVPHAPSSVAAINYKKPNTTTTTIENVSVVNTAKPGPQPTNGNSTAAAQPAPAPGPTRVFCTPAKKIQQSSANNPTSSASSVSSSSLSSHPFITYLAQTRATYMTPKAAVYSAVSTTTTTTASAKTTTTAPSSTKQLSSSNKADYLPSSPTISALPRQDSARRRLAFEN
jgi:hypothetical protein